MLAEDSEEMINPVVDPPEETPVVPLPAVAGPVVAGAVVAAAAEVGTDPVRSLFQD